MTILHVLLDRSGAYMCLERSLVCSHLESLVERIRVDIRSGGRPHRCEDIAMWRAFDHGVPESRIEWIIANKPVLIEVRRTDQSLII